MARLKDKYINEVMPKIKDEFGIENKMAIPKLEKIVINVGAGDAKDNAAIADKIRDNLTALSGQKPKITQAKKSISGFKLSQGQTVGMMVTLRGDRMYEFFDKLVTIVLPKVRDFRGVPDTSFDNQGNFNLGLREQTIFPEVGFQTAGSEGKLRGLEITVVTTAKNREQGKKLLELLGMPFRKGDK